MKESTLCGTVTEAKAVLWVEKLLLDLSRPGCSCVRVLDVASRKNPKQLLRKIKRPGPLLRHSVNLRLWPTTRKGRYKNLVFILRTAKDDELHRCPKLPEQDVAFFGRSYRVVDP